MTEAIATLALKLRTETAASHEALDRSPLLGRVTDPNLTRSEYLHLLEKMSECFARVEAQCLKVAGVKLFSDYFYESRLSDLQKDVQALDGKAFDSQKLNQNLSGIAPQTRSAAVGMLYVLHGSSLGGQFISKKLAPRMSPETLNFYGRSSEFIPMWQQFKEKINQPENGLHDDEAVLGAKWAFTTFSQVFSGI